MANEPGAIHFYQPSNHQFCKYLYVHDGIVKWKCPNHASLWSSACHSSVQLAAGKTIIIYE
jgi:hypothetical protein